MKNVPLTVPVYVKKTASLLVLVSINCVSFSFPQKSEAVLGIGDIVFDPTSYVQSAVTAIQTTASALALSDINFKETVLDPLFWTIANTALQQITQSTITWINSGFEGGPLFITNPEAFFTDLADNTIGKFIEGTGLAFLCSPFQAQIRLALLVNRSYRRSTSCTLTQVVRNFEDFSSGAPGSFSRGGGWNGWFTLTTQEQNNPYGAFLLANAQLNYELARKSNGAQREQALGRGFLSVRDPECLRLRRAAAEDGESNFSYGGDCPYTTPGAIVEQQLGSTLDIGKNRLNVADEVNEVLSALMVQLTYQILGPNGLAGLVKSSPDSGGESFETRLNREIDNQIGQTRATIAVQIDTDIGNEGTYLGVKQQLLSRATQSENLLTSLIGCWQNKFASTTLSIEQANNARTEIANASSSIASRVTPVKQAASQSIGNSQSILTQLNVYKSKTSFAAITELDSLVNDYVSFRGQVHSESSTFSAQQDLQTNSSSLDALDAETNSKISACRSL